MRVLSAGELMMIDDIYGPSLRGGRGSGGQ